MPIGLSPTGEAMLRALMGAAEQVGDRVSKTRVYRGDSDWLVLFGVGAAPRDMARNAQVGKGKRAILWDLGYFGREKVVGHLRVSVDTDHPQEWLDKGSADPRRWQAHGIMLREDANPRGHVVLVGLGTKSRAYLGLPNWERDKLAELRVRFPHNQIVYRPKPKHESPVLDCNEDTHASIEDSLRGAALVVCRHSNVAVDAAIAGVPFEAENGAAMWLARRPFTLQNRLEFLWRLAWWQWRAVEAPQAWAFLRKVLA